MVNERFYWDTQCWQPYQTFSNDTQPCSSLEKKKKEGSFIHLPCAPHLFFFLNAFKSFLSAIPFLSALHPLHPLSLRWWVGGWQQCTATCGSDGVRKRTVLCVRTVSGEERVLHPMECKHLLKPKAVVPCNRDVPCGQDWMVGNWEEVSDFFYLFIFFPEFFSD